MPSVIVPDTSCLILFCKIGELDLLKAVKPIIDRIQKTNFRISEELIERVLDKVNES